MDTHSDFHSAEAQPVELSPPTEAPKENESSSPPIPARTETPAAPGRTDWQAQQERQQAKKLSVPSYSPVDILLAKLDLFLAQQPEWAVILAAPRQARRQAANLIARRVLTIPKRDGRFEA